MCGLGDDPETVKARKPKPSLFEALTETAARVTGPAAALGGLSSPRLLYMFR
jgi:hypothetical protein